MEVFLAFFAIKPVELLSTNSVYSKLKTSTMNTFWTLAVTACLAAFSAANNGRDQIPTLPSYNCTDWESWLGESWRIIRLPHAYDCTRFYECDDRKIIEKACADRYRTRFDPFTKKCEWNYKTKCNTFYDFSKICELVNGKQAWNI